MEGSVVGYCWVETIVRRVRVMIVRVVVKEWTVFIRSRWVVYIIEIRILNLIEQNSLEILLYRVIVSIRHAFLTK